jgi:uncharacterized delta-60 repeat protein
MWPFSPRKTRCPTRRPPQPSRRLSLEALEDRCLLSSGALDPTFGSGGIVTTALTKTGDIAHGLLLQPNGDLIAYGDADTGSSQSPDVASFGLARYTPNGSLDPTFGNNGVVITSRVGHTSVTGVDDQSLGVGVSQAALQSDGKIVAVGNGRYLIRYNCNGLLDTTFGARGLVTVPSGFSIFSVLIQPSNGDIVVGGAANSAFSLLRYTPSGTLESTFGSGGEVATSIAGGNGGAGYRTLALENGDIVAGGGGANDFALARYTPSGSLDTTFGSGGIVTTVVGSSLYEGRT